MFDKYKHIEVTWKSEEERRQMKAYEWHERSPYLDLWYDFDDVFPPPKNDDYRNCDYFVYKGVCYGPGTIVRLKENKFFTPFRKVHWHTRRQFNNNYGYKPWEQVCANGKPDFIAEFRKAYMNGIMFFDQVVVYRPGKGPRRQEYGNVEMSAYAPEDYIECILEPVFVNRKIGEPSVIGNYKNLGSKTKENIEAELWPQLFIAGLFLFGSIFTNAKEFWPMLICIIIYFSVWISFRANHW